MTASTPIVPYIAGVGTAADRPAPDARPRHWRDNVSTEPTIIYTLTDEAAFITHYKRDYELPLKEIFE